LLIGIFAVIVLCSLWVILPDVNRRIIQRSLMRKSGSLRSNNSR
jgi:hypothetical protein